MLTFRIVLGGMPCLCDPSCFSVLEFFLFIFILLSWSSWHDGACEWKKRWAWVWYIKKKQKCLSLLRIFWFAILFFLTQSWGKLAQKRKKETYGITIIFLKKPKQKNFFENTYGGYRGKSLLRVSVTLDLLRAGTMDMDE